MTLSGAYREKRNHPDYYTNISKNYPKEIPSRFSEIIEKDLPRTFPSDSYFKNSGNINKLKNVLYAYSRRNDSVGYCQGFNFIVGCILKEISNEVNILRKFLFRKMLFGYSLKLLSKSYQSIIIQN